MSAEVNNPHPPTKAPIRITVRHRTGQSRLQRLRPLATPGMTCGWCEQAVGDCDVTVVAIGPQDITSLSRQQRGEWYKAAAAVVHTRCLPEMAEIVQ